MKCTLKTYFRQLLVIGALHLFTLQLSAQNAISDFQKGVLIYENTLASKADVKDWIMEGPGVTEFKDGWMEMYSPHEKFHHVFWCPKDFPGSFVAEWELQNLEPDAGLVIIFFSA